MTEETNEKPLLSAEAVKAALAVAPKNDIRSYLNGICFKKVNGKNLLVSTNGHAIFWHEAEIIGDLLEGDKGGNGIILKKFTVPARTKHIRFTPGETEWRADFLTAPSTISEVIESKNIPLIMDGKYPDVSTLISRENDKPSLEGGMIGVRTEYLKMVNAVFGKASTNITFNSNAGMMIFHSTEMERTAFGVMPIRLDY